MALTDKLASIANAIRGKSGKTGKLSLDQMASEISSLKTTFSTQSKSVTLSETSQTIEPDSGIDGLSSVYVPGISSTYVGSGVTKQTAKTITPTKIEQTAVNTNVYTTGVVKVGAIPDQYIIPDGDISIIENGTYDVKDFSEAIVNIASSSAGLPTGISKIAFGSYTFSADMGSNSSTTSSTYQKTIDHDLGVIPDLILFYSEGNIAKTYSMLGMAWGNSILNWRGSTYKCNAWYHGNSTTTVAGTSCNASYGIRNVTSTQFSLKTYTSSTSYYWREGTYKWIAIKF